MEKTEQVEQYLELAARYADEVFAPEVSSEGSRAIADILFRRMEVAWKKLSRAEVAAVRAEQVQVDLEAYWLEQQREHREKLIAAFRAAHPKAVLPPGFWCTPEFVDGLLGTKLTAEQHNVLAQVQSKAALELFLFILATYVAQGGKDKEAAEDLQKLFEKMLKDGRAGYEAAGLGGVS